ncbi:MAG: hypothetical protein U0531_20610 [Dehalococcoidia bacterium]
MQRRLHGRRRLPRHHLRAMRPGRRLLALTVPIMLLLAAVGLALAWRDYQSRRAHALAQTALLARAAAGEADRFLRDRLALLSAVAATPMVRDGDVAALADYLRRLDLPSLGFSGGSAGSIKAACCAY